MCVTVTVTVTRRIHQKQTKKDKKQKKTSQTKTKKTFRQHYNNKQKQRNFYVITVHFTVQTTLSDNYIASENMKNTPPSLAPLFPPNSLSVSLSLLLDDILIISFRSARKKKKKRPKRTA